MTHTKMNPQNNNFYKLNMLALGIESPPSDLSAKRKDSYKWINGGKLVDSKQLNLKKSQTSKLMNDIKIIMQSGVLKNKYIYQELENKGLMPKIKGESPSDNALRIYVKKVRRQIVQERANAN